MMSFPLATPVATPLGSHSPYFFGAVSPSTGVPSAKPFMENYSPYTIKQETSSLPTIANPYEISDWLSLNWQLFYICAEKLRVEQRVVEMKSFLGGLARATIGLGANHQEVDLNGFCQTMQTLGIQFNHPISTSGPIGNDRSSSTFYYIGECIYQRGLFKYELQFVTSEFYVRGLILLVS